MSLTIDQITPENIRETVVQIVESLSMMVMDCIKGDIQTRVKNHCTKLVTATNQLIAMAKVTAVDDPALTIAVTNQIKESHKCVGNFIDAFVQLTRNTEDQQVNVLFSQESKRFADNIILLTDIIDPTSTSRLVILMKKAVLDLSAVEKLCSVDWPQKDPIIAACKQFESNSKLLILNATMALNISVLEQKRLFFDQALDTLEESAVGFLDNARKFSKDPHDPMNSEYQRLALEGGQDFASGVTKLIQAVQEEEVSPFQKFFAAIEYIQVLIVKAKKLSKAVLILNHSVSKSQQWHQVSEIVKLVEAMLQQTMNVTKDVMDKETDPAKRAFLEGCIWDFEDIIPEFSNACQDYQQSQDDQTKLRIVELGKNILRVNGKIHAGVDDDSFSADYVVNLGALALTNLDDAGHVLTTEEAAFNYAGATGSMTDVSAIPNIVDQMIEDTADEEIKNCILENRDMVIEAFGKFLEERKALMLAPSAAGHAMVEDLKADLIELIGEENFTFFECQEDMLSDKGR